MPITGTIRNGRVEFDGPITWPNGSKVLLELDGDEAYEYPHPMAPYDREKEIEGLLESIEDMKAGRVMDFHEFMDAVAEKYNLVPASPRVIE